MAEDNPAGQRGAPPHPTPDTGGDANRDDAKQVLGPDDVRRAVTRMAHEINERNRGVDGVALVGIAHGGIWLAEALGSSVVKPIPGLESGMCVLPPLTPK